MLVPLKELLADAKEKSYAVGAFNCPNLESVLAIIGAAEELQCPVILNHAEVHNTLIPIETIAPVMLDFAKKASVPVCVHLDHGTTFEMCIKAIRLGFTSIMYDASGAEYEANVAHTEEMVRIAHACGVSVEAELGHILTSENSGQPENPDDIYTSPASARDFVERTGVDALAIAFGTAHGIYKVKPVLDLDRILKIKEAVDIPFVMHGGSGLSETEFRAAIKNGITKINYYTYMTLAGGQEVIRKLSGKTSEDTVFFHDISLWAADAMKANVREAMRIFSMR